MPNNDNLRPWPKGERKPRSAQKKLITGELEKLLEQEASRSNRKTYVAACQTRLARRQFSLGATTRQGHQPLSSKSSP